MSIACFQPGMAIPGEVRQYSSLFPARRRPQCAACRNRSSDIPIDQRGASMAELKKIDVVQGSGAEAKSGPVVVHYTGWLHDPAKADGHGRKFDTSLDRNSPFEFVLGAGQVIRGWDEGVAGMKVGGERTL